MFSLTFQTENAAFENHLLHGEIARILKEVANKVKAGNSVDNIYDTNGNKIGNYVLVK